MRNVLILSLLAYLVAGCTSFVQTTSGADYLETFDGADLSPGADDALRAVADIEPLLGFPSRIGIARIENGALVNVPGVELTAWLAALEPIADQYGEFVPVNPFIADLVAPETQDRRYDRAEARREAIRRIRLAGARQHLDAVLVYEAHALSKVRNTGLALADLTLIGAYIAPGRKVDADGAAAGLLFDVRNNYPYASLSAESSAHAKSSTVNAHAVAGDLADAAAADAAAALAKTFARETLPDLKQALQRGAG